MPIAQVIDQGATNNSTGSSNAVLHFEFWGDVYLFYDEAAAASGFDVAKDIVVRLTGDDYTFTDSNITGTISLT